MSQLWSTPVAGPPALLLAACLFGVAAPAAAQDAAGWFELHPWRGSCAGNCAAAIYGGWAIENSMSQVFLTAPEPPSSWDYKRDHLVATTISRRIATLWARVDVEPELGLGQRFGEQDETEIWGAVFLRYRGFPWDRAVVTSAALSTGFNYASAVSEEEVERARDGKGSRWMHFFSPEITFALPRSPQVELLFRFHHRSGVFGLVSDAWGGAQYGAIGLRVRF
ncbi:MAG: hypothetical protein H0T41_12450 [Rhodobacteraceae bacterium]|nr:hypothetical protein [Paracoccaceae bacterium]